ncbi:hypothetical protein ACFLYK_03535 [Candidatus Cloacimonadota bacterium]
MKKISLIFLITILVLFNSFLFAQKAASPVSKSSKTEDNSYKTITAEPGNGYIGDIYEIDTIKIYTEDDPTYVVFTFDEFQLWAKVRGSSGAVLGEFYLPDGDVITLSGTGDFIIELYSKSGSGDWKCEAMNQTDYDILYNWDWDELADLLVEIIAEPMSGYLADKYEIDRISVDTIVSPAHVVFSWDTTMNPFVKIYNEAEELLATYDLNDGEVISLNDTGLYTLHIYADDGYGDWSIEVFNDEDFKSNESESYDLNFDDAKDFVNSFLKDMIAENEDKLMNYISPDYISNNYLTVSDYQVNKYYPVDYFIDSYNSDTGMVRARIWGEDKGWIHGLDFKVVWEDGRYYLQPGTHSDSYIDPWYRVDPNID